MRRMFLLLCIAPLFATAQQLPAIEEKTKFAKKYEGFLNFYWEDNTGKIWLEIATPETEILSVVSLAAGLGSNDLGLDRGMIGKSRIVRFSKAGSKILLTEPNYRYRAVTGSPAEKKAVEQSFAQSVLWGFDIAAETRGRYLIDATDFLLHDAMQISSLLQKSQQGNYTIDKQRSAIYLPNTRNFPLNSEFEGTVTYVNKDGSEGGFVRSVTPSAEAVSLRIHHSFVQLPDADYSPRLYDPRSSYMPVSFFDYSSPVSGPVRTAFIKRHRLKKKDPSAAVSEAVKPIVYYLDNGTPEPVRTALLEGARWWDQAFEAAGYKNAFQVKILPEDADPMDIRYNMINWVHRSTRGWSYGASVTDPRTGEIIKGNVTLGSLRVRQDYLIATGLLAPFETGTPPDDKMLTMALDRLKQLSAHEIGHTIGLQHNYAASVSNRASVMDYPHPLVRLNSKGEIDLNTSAYDDKIGPWDKLAIRFGYQDFPEGVDERAELDKILNEAHREGLQFITDQDARDPGGLHPQAHLWDNGTDAVEELKEVMKVRTKALTQFGEKNIRPGTPMATLEEVLVPVYLYHRYQAEAVAKLVGGMQYSYAMRGDGQTVTRPVTKQDQQKALQSLIDCLDPGFLEMPEHIVRLVPPRPPGYYSTQELFRKRTGLAFDALSPAETAADLPLSLLFNSKRLNRMVQYELSEKGLGVAEMVRTLINKTWKAPRQTGIKKLIQLQTEQVLLTYLLASSVETNNSFVVQSVIRQSLVNLKSFIEEKSKSATDDTYRGHLLLALERIKDPSAAQPSVHKEIPPGAPIGCGQE